MVYSDVVAKGLILSKKNKYTLQDVNKVMIESLVKPLDGKTIDFDLACFIVKCSEYFMTRIILNP